MKRGPHGTNGVATSGRIHEEVIGKLEACGTSNGRNPKEHKMAVRQKEKKPSRPEDWQTCVAGKQKYPVKPTLKEAR